ncbi:solute carrier family 43 member 3 [Biomphalaria glabrata]|uniref:Equilibrative nucleobase transporter 1-like n=1 Tax=Biomphalaria glabrata TaxID=6526 RepID=A0A2C9LC12_BIOGL|nr:equilibrative nucleobase transporter 1-like [Biomphalaria glabrata]KAI8796843.1 solute carrier family 43 member 3 [Biomphalaria glabrata]
MLSDNPKFRVLYASWAFLECLFFGGLIYGWPSLVFVLKDEGLYYDLCSFTNTSQESIVANNSIANVSVENVYDTSSSVYNISVSTDPARSDKNNVTETRKERNSCRDMDDRLSLVFTIGTAVFCIGCFIMGQISYLFGTRITRIIATALFVIGSLLVAFTSNDVPWLIFPGLSLLGAGGITFLMTNMQISVYFPKLGTLVVGLFCGGFDTSAGMQMLIKIGYENGISRYISYLILAVANLVTLVSTFLFLPKGFVTKPSTKKYPNDEVADDKTAAVELKSPQNDENEVQESEKPRILSCIFSCRYLFHVFWLCILQLRFYCFLGSLNKTLEVMFENDHQQVSYYTNILFYVLMCGLLSSPFAGIVCDGFKRLYVKQRTELQRMLMPTVIPLTITTSLCILLSLLVLFETPEVMIPAYLCLLFFRSFLYTLGAGYISVMFPSEYFGILYGIVIIAGGIVSMFQYVFFNWAETSGFYPVNLFLLILMITTYIHPAFQWFVCRRDGRTGKLLVKE